MTKLRRRFSILEKLSILREVNQFGVDATVRKHNLSRDAIERWRGQLAKRAVGNPNLDDPEVEVEVFGLQLEIERLKKIIEGQKSKLEGKSTPSKEQKTESMEIDKEDQFLKFVGSLIAQVVLRKHEERNESSTDDPNGDSAGT
jgi:transposase-like protein